MMDFVPIPELISRPGLRLVIVRGVPSPWSQAARAIFRAKELEYVVGAQIPGGENSELVAWCGQNSGPVVAYENEPPIHRYMDILLLAERLAPKPALLPAEIEDRVRVVGLLHELAGDGGIGWWARIAMFDPLMRSGSAPAEAAAIAQKWHYTPAAADRAAHEVAVRLGALAASARANRERGSRFLVGDQLTALDLHWAAMSCLLALLPEETASLPPGYRPLFEQAGALPEIAEALDPALIAHRDFILERYFETPFDYD